ncbi:hypothetical protein ABT173_40355 [Streptomyces sp. NPDC001795]|uniref:hypothetical protein n=1 Tax=Streptomyces sp. NPDC001795 TaxID=3154525 RepID=UPI003324A5DC
MARHGIRDTAWGLAVVIAAAFVLSGCSGKGSPSTTASKAASAAESLASQGSSAAASLASEASSAMASATSEAAHKLDEIKGGVNAKGDARLGTVSTEADGRKSVQVTVSNSTSQSRSYAVQVDFRDHSGKLLDVALVTVDDVAAGASKNATALSHRKLSGDVTADAGRVVRY